MVASSCDAPLKTSQTRDSSFFLGSGLMGHWGHPTPRLPRDHPVRHPAIHTRCRFRSWLAQQTPVIHSTGTERRRRLLAVRWVGRSWLCLANTRNHLQSAPQRPPAKQALLRALSGALRCSTALSLCPTLRAFDYLLMCRCHLAQGRQSGNGYESLPKGLNGDGRSFVDFQGDIDRLVCQPSEGHPDLPLG